MTDATIYELLSRHLDGDLDADEERELRNRLEGEPELRAELEAMQQLRSSVASLAAAERVPPELDQLVDPLLRGKPEAVGVRPWVRWLATAAAVLLGATVVIEVNRRNPGPSIDSIAKVAEESRQAKSSDRFALAPLPTSSIPPDQQPIGASDRLLASPIADVEFEDPPALEVLGPLEAGERPRSVDEMSAAAPAGATTEPSAMTANTDAMKHQRDKDALPMAKSGPASQREEMRADRGADRGDALRPWDAAPPTGRGQLFVFIDGKSAWREFTPEDTCKPGRYAVRIVVVRGAVREVRPVGGAASATPSQRLCAADLVLELEIEGVADGEYPAEVVVEPRGPGR
jgi:hypothetical protein